jgi:hypothetical protein
MLNPQMQSVLYNLLPDLDPQSIMIKFGRDPQSRIKTFLGKNTALQRIELK